MGIGTRRLEGVTIKGTPMSPDESKDTKKKENPFGNSLGAGMALGIGTGTAIGVSLDNIGMGIAIGVALGPGFALALNAKNKKKS